VTLASLDEALGADGAPLFIVFLCLPFLFPVPVPGFSTAFGAAICYLALRSNFSTRTGLPDFVGKRQLSAETVKRMGEGGHSLLRRMERFVKPRLRGLTGAVGRHFVTIAMLSSALALAVPCPPIVPFTNTLPALAIIFLAVSLLTRDGLAALIGHALHFVSWIYLATVASIAFAFAIKAWELTLQGWAWLQIQLA